MKQNTFDKKDGMLKKHSKKKFWKKVVAMLSCVTVFCTSYTMIMPAMTMSETTYCGREEGPDHTHTLQCYSNPNADLETEANWTATIPTLSGNWNEDVVAVANSQLGYQESTANYQVADNNEKKGYNRYGAWMNEPYADWNTDFVLFCLHYANVDTNSLSLSNDISTWASNSAYVTKDSYTPKAGDLIILDENNDGAADHAAVITEANGNTIKIVEGDYNNAVAQENYDTTDARVIGYIQMPQNPAMVQSETAEETAAAETSAPEETAVPEAAVAPEATTAAAETAEPETTAAPEAAETAEASSAPEAASTAEAAATAEATASPETTATPEVTTAPEATPDATSKPSLVKRFMAKMFKAAASKTQDITGNLTDASIKINGQDVTDTTWNVKANTSYEIALTFKENSSSQFPNDDTWWMTYPIPDGLTVEEFETTFDMVVDGKTISGNKLVVDKASGLIKLQWNTSDANFKTLTDANNAYVSVKIKASFDSTKKEITFSDLVKRDVDVDTTHNASVDKTGYYDQSDGKIHYTVTVTSSGTSKDVVVTDNINGTALTYDNNVAYTSTKGATATMSKKGNGFTATIPSMSDGEQVKFTYTATVDLDKLKESGTVKQSETSNGVKITCPDDHDGNDNSKTQYVNYISFSSIGKNAQSVSDTYTENGKTYRTITWNLKANEERKKHLTYISDSIGKDSQSIMTYSGDGLTIIVTKEDGKQETRTVKWTDSSITKTDTGWTYTPPASDGKATYNVTYTTKADVTDLITARNVSNDAKTDYNSTTGNTSVGPTKDNEFSGSKSVTKMTDDEISWMITVNVPAKGLDKLVVTDTLPNAWLNNQHMCDTFGAIKSVTGLDDNESYVVDSTSDTTKFTMTFYKDKNQTKPGMNSSTGNRTITIRFTTKNNKDWMDYASQHPYDSYPNTHTNNAKINDLDVHADAIYKPSEQKVTKEGALKKENDDHAIYTDSKGQKWRIIEYNIHLSGVTDNETLTDTFDKTLGDSSGKTHLEYFNGVWNQWYTDNSAGAIYGGDVNYQGNAGGSGFTVTEIDTGLTFNTGTLPRQADGTLYSHYRIHYYLMVQINYLQQLAIKSKDATGKTTGTAKISNSVQWGTKGDAANVYYPYPGVSKTCNDDGKVATYTIKVNPDALQLNGGNPMQLKDTFTNQVIDFSTIKITDDKSGKDITKNIVYDFSGNTVTFTIPDSTSITITYQAKPVGKVGSTVTMTNKAEMSAYQSETSDHMTIGGSGSGGASTVSLRLMKYAKGNVQKKLSGAVFQLFDADGNALKYDIGDKKGQNITFTTGSDGYVDIKLSSSTEYTKGLEYGKTYKLKEITAPAGYQLADGYISFTISDDGSRGTDLYANGDTFAVADKKITNVKVTLTKVDSENTSKTLSGAVFDLYGSDYVNSDGSLNTSAKAISTGLTTGSDGTVALGTLQSGTYYLDEKMAPEGYGVGKNPIKIVVTDDKVTVVQGTDTRNSDITDGSSGQTAVITVTDDKAYNLPKTGGSGTTMIYVAGGVLVAAAVVMFVIQKRKRS